MKELSTIFTRIKRIFKFIRSMRIQVFIVLFLAGIIPVMIFSEIILKTHQENVISTRVSELQEKNKIISNLLLSSNYFVHTEGMEESNVSEVELEMAQVAENYQGRIVVADNNLRVVHDTYGLEEGKTVISEQAIIAYKGNASKYVDIDAQIVELVSPVTDLVSKENKGTLIMSFSLRSICESNANLRQKAGTIILVIMLIIILLAFVYAIFITRTLARVNQAIDHATDGYLNEPVSMKGFTEIESIADSFNRLLGRLQQLEDSRQEFVSNVSHELKTPITSIKVLSESLIGQEDVPVELYREFMQDITEEIERENKIINDLLSLVKLDKTSGDLNISQVDINELLEQILKRLGPIAQQRNIELVLESFRAVMAEVDEVKLTLAITNLIENAIKYNFDDGWVRVSLNADHKFFYVKVSDSGVGIPEELQDNIFERFYRVDKARSRETGGTGLGLSITKNVILMHRGAIKVYSREKEGSTFTVRIPLNYVA